MASLRRKVVIGPKAVVVRGSIVNRKVEEIGAWTQVHGGCVFKGRSPISIGKYCEIAQGVHIVSSNHEVNRANLHVGLQMACDAGDLLDSRGPVRIGNNVWLADYAVVLPGVTIGDGAVVGAGSVVTRDVEPFAIVAGTPAKMIRKRFSDEVIEALGELAWWDWPEETVLAHRELLERDLTAEGAAVYLRQLAADIRQQGFLQQAAIAEA